MMMRNLWWRPWWGVWGILSLIGGGGVSPEELREEPIPARDQESLLQPGAATESSTEEPRETPRIGPKVVEIEFRGLKNVPEHNVRDVIQTQVGEVFDSDTLKQDVDAIFNLGFFLPEGGVVALPEPLPDGNLRITFELRENPLIQRVVWTGNTLFSGEELQTVLKFLRPGQVWNWNNVDADLDNLENFYQERDYAAFAQLGDPPVDEEGTVYLQIHELRIHQIHFEFERPPKTKEKVLRREMELRPGSYYSSRQLSEDLRRIFNLNLFEDVRRGKVVQGPEPDTVDVTIEVRERERTGTITAGAGFSSRYGLLGFANVSENNLQGMARRANLRVEFGGRRSYDLSLFEPWLDRRHTSLTLGVYDTSAQLDTFFPGASGSFRRSRDYDQRRQGVHVGLSRPLNQDTRMGLDLKSETVATRRSVGSQALPLPPPFPFQELGRDSTQSLGLSVAQDTRDVVFDPSRGSRLSLGLEFAGGPFGGDNDFLKYNLELRRYWPVGSSQVATESEERKVPRTVLAARMKYGGSSGRLPFSQVYFAGGADTLRGYEEDRWFGDRMFLFNLECRYRLQPSLQGVLFFDTGRAWREGEPLNLPDSLASSYGLGIRVKTPLGPLRLDYGIGSEGGRTAFGFAQQF